MPLLRPKRARLERWKKLRKMFSLKKKKKTLPFLITFGFPSRSLFVLFDFPKEENTEHSVIGSNVTNGTW